MITGAGRGMGVEFAKAALAAGDKVVATGRNPAAVARAVGESDDLLVVKLDVTSSPDADAAVEAAVVRFGGIDVLLAQGDDIAPIPGTKRVSRVEENAAADSLELSTDQIQRLNDLTPATGDRHDETNMAVIDG